METILKLSGMLIITCFLMIACLPQEKYFETEEFQLRQLNNEKEITTSSSAAYFLVFGAYSSSTNIDYKVKVFAKVNNYYRFIEIPIEKIRININDSIKIPTLKVKYIDFEGKNNEKVLSYQYYNYIYIITCPEIYLPEKLLPIDITTN